MRTLRVTLLCATVALVTICAAQQDNRVINSGFEDGADGEPAGWQRNVIKGEGAEMKWTQTLRSGRCLSIGTTQPAVKAGWASDQIPIIAGDTLNISMQVKLADLQPGPGGGVGFRITCHFHDDAAYLTWAPSPGTMESGDWREVSFTCVAPPGATSVVLGFRLSGCTGTALVDDVKLLAQAPEREESGKPYGLQPGDPAAAMTVAVITGDIVTTPGSRQFIDLLGHEGIATVAWDRINIAEFPERAEGLADFAALLIGGMNAQAGAGLLSETQTAAVSEWVTDGGGLVACAPAVTGTALAGLFPAEIGAGVRDWHFIPETALPDHPALADICFPLPGLGFKHNATTCYAIRATDNAEVLATIPQQVAGPDVPFLVCGRSGEGRVALINSTWTGSIGYEFVTWRYAPRLLGQLARWTANLPQPADKPALPDPHEPIVYGGRWHGAAPVQWPVASDPEKLPQAKLDLAALPRPVSVERAVTDAPGIEEQADRVVVTFANGVRVIMHKSAQIELLAPDGTRLTAEPADERPFIAASGTEATDLIVDVEQGASEPQIFKQPIEKSRTLGEGYSFRACEVTGAGVTFVFDIPTGGEPATLRWSFIPRTVEIEGATWHGVGDRYEVETGGQFVDSIMGRYPWRIGETVTDDRLMRLACYARPRGYFEMPLDQAGGPHNAWSYFASGQPFQILGGDEGTLAIYYDEPTQIRARQVVEEGRDAVYFDHRVVIGRRRGTVATPRQWMMFSPARLDENLWLAVHDHIKREYAARYGVSPSEPKACGQMRLESLGTRFAFRGRTVQMRGGDWTASNLREMADYFLPLAAERGIRRLDVGSIVNVENPLDAQAEPEKFAAMKYLIDRAHALGIECFIYWRITFWNRNAPLIVDHPEWWQRKRDGTPFVVGSLMNLSLRSGWYDWSLTELTRIKDDLGIDGMWFDSLAPAMDCVNYAEEEPQPVVQRGIEYFRDVCAAGLDFWVEGMHPLALDSYWYRSAKYDGPFQGHEFCLADSSMYAHGPDSVIYLDPFRLAAFRAPMMADVRELTVAEDPITRAQARANRIFNAASDALDEVYAVRAMDFGSVWVGERGYAVFAFEDRRVDMALGAGEWTVTMPEGRGGSVTFADGHITGHMLEGEAAIISR